MKAETFIEGYSVNWEVPTLGEMIDKASPQAADPWKYPEGCDAWEAAERQKLHQRLAHASALIEYGLDKGLIRLRDRDGNLLLHLGQWLAAVEAGKWPGVEVEQGSRGAEEQGK